MTDYDENSVETQIVQGLHYIDAQTGGVIPPIMPSTTFARGRDYALLSEKHSYGRDENPTFATAEEMLARMEGGADCLLFSSGMAAAANVMHCLEPGSQVVIPRVMYWGLRNWMVGFCKRWGIELEQFDASDPDDLAAVVQADRTTLVWIETPTNPTWDVIDIETAAEIAHGAGALLAVDSTVATPVLTRPLEFGADIVMHSATKYLNGHGDVVAGALVTAESSEFWQRLRHERSESGAILGSFEAWLLQRGMRTLFMRVRQASASAQIIAEHFQGHRLIDAVLYPGLENHPAHDVAKKQMQGGFGGMLSFCVAGGQEAALKLVGACNVFIRATSLGGVESLIEHRYSIEGASSPIPENLVRLSIGVEPVADLIADLEQALEASRAC